MPWSGQTFRKHNKGLTPSQSNKAASIANAVLKRTGSEASAIRIANSKAKQSAAHKLYPNHN